MEDSTRFKSSLGKRSIVARLVAVLALLACGAAIYFVVMAFTENRGDGDERRERKNRSEQTKGQETAEAFDVGHALALR